MAGRYACNLPAIAFICQAERGICQANLHFGVCYNIFCLQQADALLRKDLRKFCAMFQRFWKDSLLLATLAYNVGPFRPLGSGKIPKSKLIRKLEAGDRNIYREYIAFCNYKGKQHTILLKRRKVEFALLYEP